MTVSLRCVDLALLPLGGSRSPSPIQLAQRQLSRGPLIKLVRHRVHWSTWSVHMDIGQSKLSLQRPLLNPHRLSLGMGYHVTRVSEPAVFGDQDAVVPAITEGPEVEPPEPAHALRRGVQLDGIKIETRERTSHRKLNFGKIGNWEQHARGVRFIVVAVVLGVAEDIDVHPVPAQRLPEQRLTSLDTLDAIDRH